MRKNHPFKIAILLFACSLALPGIAHAQEEETGRRQIISFVPQYLINNGIRVDYDLEINKNRWIQLAPQFYLREKSSSSPEESNEEFNRLLGAGLHAYYKYYPGEGLDEHGIYLSYGLTYQYFNLLYDEKKFTNTVERYSNIQKVGGDICIGINTKIMESLTLDFYTGLGFRYAFLDSDAEAPKRFNSFFTDYGYTGNLIILGVRIGFITR